MISIGEKFVVFNWPNLLWRNISLHLYKDKQRWFRPKRKVSRRMHEPKVTTNFNENEFKKFLCFFSTNSAGRLAMVVWANFCSFEPEDKRRMSRQFRFYPNTKEKNLEFRDNSQVKWLLKRRSLRIEDKRLNMCETEDNNTHLVNNFDKHPNHLKRKSIESRTTIKCPQGSWCFTISDKISFRIVLLVEEFRGAVRTYEDSLKKSQLLMMRLISSQRSLFSSVFVFSQCNRIHTFDCLSKLQTKTFHLEINRFQSPETRIFLRWRNSSWWFSFEFCFTWFWTNLLTITNESKWKTNWTRNLCFLEKENKSTNHKISMKARFSFLEKTNYHFDLFSFSSKNSSTWCWEFLDEPFWP